MTSVLKDRKVTQVALTTALQSLTTLCLKNDTDVAHYRTSTHIN